MVGTGTGAVVDDKRPMIGSVTAQSARTWGNGVRGDPLTDDDQVYCLNVLVVDEQWVRRAVAWCQFSDCECCARHIQAAPVFEQTLITLTSQNKTCWIPNNKISFTYLCTDGNTQVPFRPTRRQSRNPLSRWWFFCWREDWLAGGRHCRPLFCTVSQLQRRKASLASTFSLQSSLLPSSLPSGGVPETPPYNIIAIFYSRYYCDMLPIRKRMTDLTRQRAVSTI